MSAALADSVPRDRLIAAYLVTATGVKVSGQLVPLSGVLVARVGSEVASVRAVLQALTDDTAAKLREANSSLRLSFATALNERPGDGPFTIDRRSAQSIIAIERILNESVTAGLARALVDQAIKDCESRTPEINLALDALESAALASI